MKISVIIPVKNRASLLPVTLNNILLQTYKPYEIIVIDDGSTDNIGDVIAQYQDRVIFKKNSGKGPGAARNEGLRMATGDVIQFFDSDDLMTLNKLEVQVKLLQSTSADLVYGPYVKAFMDASGAWKQVDVIMQYYPLPAGKLNDFVLEGWCPITQSVLFKKELIDAVGFWREDLMTHEDYEYWYRISKKVKKFVHENEACVIYRQHENQITDKAVTVKERWLDAFHASECILSNISSADSLKSKWVFKGRWANSKIAYLKSFGNSEGVSIELSEKILALYSRAYNKVGRVLSGTPWLKMHGTLKNGHQQFNDYISSLGV